jgi:ribonucleoside-diphosphate reductase alpha chain
MEALYLDKETEAETAFCSLGAIVPVNIKDDVEYERVAYTLVKTINALIFKCPKMTKNHERTMLARMSLGVGITGLAEYLYKKGYDYDGSDESLEFVSDLAEKHCFYLYVASQKLSEETGLQVEGVDLNWLPVDTKVGKFTPKMDWESLRGKPRVNSVLVAHMPTESSALASGVTNGLYPPRKRVINKKSRKGVVQFICKDFVVGKNLLAWDIDNVTLSRYYSAIQDWTDQGISADTYVDLRKYEDGKKPLSQLLKEWVAHFRLGNKSMYYVNTYDNDEASVFDLVPETEEDCESCKL